MCFSVQYRVKLIIVLSILLGYSAFYSSTLGGFTMAGIDTPVKLLVL